MFTLCGVNTSCVLILQARISDASIFSNSSMSATIMSPFQMLSAYNTDHRKIPGKTFFPNWWSLDWSLAEIGGYSIIDPKGSTCTLNGSQNRRSKGVCPIRSLERVADNSYIHWKQPSTFHPRRIARVLQNFLR